MEINDFLIFVIRTWMRLWRDLFTLIASPKDLFTLIVSPRDLLYPTMEEFYSIFVLSCQTRILLQEILEESTSFLRTSKQAVWETR